jgi:hypothetical protein
VCLRLVRRIGLALFIESRLPTGKEGSGFGKRPLSDRATALELFAQCLERLGLMNQGVGVGDLLLFWGLFRPVAYRSRWR